MRGGSWASTRRAMTPPSASDADTSPFPLKSGRKPERERKPWPRTGFLQWKPGQWHRLASGPCPLARRHVRARDQQEAFGPSAQSFHNCTRRPIGSATDGLISRARFTSTSWRLAREITILGGRAGPFVDAGATICRCVIWRLDKSMPQLARGHDGVISSCSSTKEPGDAFLLRLLGISTMSRAIIAVIRGARCRKGPEPAGCLPGMSPGDRGRPTIICPAGEGPGRPSRDTRSWRCSTRFIIDVFALPEDERAWKSLELKAPRTRFDP